MTFIQFLEDRYNEQARNITTFEGWKDKVGMETIIDYAEIYAREYAIVEIKALRERVNN